MPTPEQVEAVVREIERRTDPTMAGVMLTATPNVIAQAAIAAYENARPTVSDEELADLEDRAIWWHTHFQPAIDDDNNYYRGECNIDGKDAADIGEFAAQVAKLVRAVRERLEP